MAHVGLWVCACVCAVDVHVLCVHVCGCLVWTEGVWSMLCLCVFMLAVVVVMFIITIIVFI